MRQKVSASSHFPFVSEMFCWYQLSVLGTLIFYIPRATYAEAVPIETTNNCDPCLHVTRTGNSVRTVLLFHTYYNCIGEIIGTCTHNLTVYKICKPKNGALPLCFNPEMGTTWEFELRAVSPWGIRWGERGKLLGPLINRTIRVKPGDTVTLYFDACAAINSADEANKLYPPTGGETKFPLVGCGGLEWERDYSSREKYMCPWKGDWCSGIGEFGCVYWSCVEQATWQIGSSLKRLKPPPSCTLGTCNPVTLNILDPQDPEWEEGKAFGLRIDGQGLDPGTVVHIRRHTYVPATSSLQVFHSSYKEMVQPLPQITPVTQNLFMGLVENIAYSLNITSCYVCGGTLVGDHWPWEAREWDPADQEALKLKINGRRRGIQPSIKGSNPWVLKTNIIGRRCLTRKGEQFQDQVGELTCLGQRFYNEAKGRTEWWGKETEVNPLAQFPGLRPGWKNVNASIHWSAPKGLYWICGNRAYAQLPANWAGSCILGTIKPSFFLLPLHQGELLGCPVYAHFHEKRNIPTGNWKDDEWPPERIIQYYGPATWSEDGVWGYRTPTYMLNRIIRLQAVLEITTNETALMLNLLANQQSQNAVYQSRLALDYLLAKEGGVCGKFNFTSCCLQIDDQGRVIKEITNRMQELSRVSVQTWKGWNPGETFGGGFSTSGGFKAMVGGFIAIVGICLIILCLLPVARRVLKSMIETTIDQKITRRILWGKGYQSMDDYVNMDVGQLECKEES
ncbi:PREDICTED: rap1 GTPase-activating protein 2 isoform X6 [Chinchilla lanigera]|uniref:rap1 GTPase-activating protein 2 isoform X6 n=1 Tax=Chinchilla lanigera TaxID=34839 RepID=UPI00038EA06D|nr:PREDICTED: rap1 GTPase-activating protein 2 isoform X6 [Chinchilla lanigera]XP_013358930.1 PREDICTED: rap1 GTPase-activating protein 2 isoform X6 [Chinchilla lanigera]